MANDIIHEDEEENPHFQIGDTVRILLYKGPANGEQYNFGPGRILDRDYAPVNYGYTVNSNGVPEDNTYIMKWCYHVQCVVHITPPLKANGEPNKRFKPERDEVHEYLLEIEDLDGGAKYTTDQILAKFVKAGTA